jgi:hypothetical protein
MGRVIPVLVTDERGGRGLYAEETEAAYAVIGAAHRHCQETGRKAVCCEISGKAFEVLLEELRKKARRWDGTIDASRLPRLPLTMFTAVGLVQVSALDMLASASPRARKDEP